jgi:hypothetical protein
MNQSTVAHTPRKNGSLAGGIGCLVIVGAVCACVLYTICNVANALWQVYLLASRGQPAVAKVTGYTPEKRWASGRHKPDIQVHFHTVEFEGHSGKVRLPAETPVGTEIRVLYLPEDPDVVAAGEQGDSSLTLLDGRALGSNAWDSLMCLDGWWRLFIVFVIAKLWAAVFRDRRDRGNRTGNAVAS